MPPRKSAKDFFFFWKAFERGSETNKDIIIGKKSKENFSRKQEQITTAS
jgi:hypothetical protein